MPASTRRIAVAIKGLMAEQRVTQTQLGDALGRRQSYVSDRLTPKDAFSTWELEQIASVLGFNDAFELLDEVRRRSQQ